MDGPFFIVLCGCWVVVVWLLGDDWAVGIVVRCGAVFGPLRSGGVFACEMERV